jgi:hypothetical protein
MSATLTDEGKPRLDVDGDVGNVVLLQTAERARKISEKAKPTDAVTDAELWQRRLTTVELVVMGASIRQVAERHDVDYQTARDDYFTGLAAVNDRTSDAVIAMRDEVTMRERSLILAMMPLAKAGDTKAAGVIQRADDMIAGLWGLRSARLDVTVRPSSLQDALNSYLEAAVEASATG